MADSEIQDDDNASKSTFVQADSKCFRDLVQRLTGPSPVKSPAPKPTPTKKKLHERRRHRIKPNIDISKPAVGFQFQSSQPPPSFNTVGGYGPRSNPSSPSSVIMKSLSSSLPPSPTSTAVVSHHKRLSQTPVELNRGEEERAIKEKRFYLHPSPRSKQRVSELLTLFPPTSPANTKQA